MGSDTSGSSSDGSKPCQNIPVVAQVVDLGGETGVFMILGGAVPMLLDLVGVGEILPKAIKVIGGAVSFAGVVIVGINFFCWFEDGGIWSALGHIYGSHQWTGSWHPPSLFDLFPSWIQYFPPVWIMTHFWEGVDGIFHQFTGEHCGCKAHVFGHCVWKKGC
jgi:hypothetical protein